MGHDTGMVVRYHLPQNWIHYEFQSVAQQLTGAKAAMLALTQIPYQRSWADRLQSIQLKREVAGTSRIEGAEFTERELDAALKETPHALFTRSQRQAAAAVATYRWLSTVSADVPITPEFLAEIHRRLVTGCDDDHCQPGQIRSTDQNVTFGIPRHRGAEGGRECIDAVNRLCRAIQAEFQGHDPLVQALAVHYHFAAIHPYLDGNGRTARALEALMLQRLGLKDTLFIAMSNYYYEEKAAYLSALSESRASGHDLGSFLSFGLKGVELQCNRLLAEIREEVQKALYRNTMTDLFGRLKSPRKRVMSARHVQVLTLLLNINGEIDFRDLVGKSRTFYTVKNPMKALVRDLVYLATLGAIRIRQEGENHWFSVQLEWPTQITETEFFKLSKTMPKGKVHGFLSS
jgi:Fic family protein